MRASVESDGTRRAGATLTAQRGDKATSESKLASSSATRAQTLPPSDRRSLCDLARTADGDHRSHRRIGGLRRRGRLGRAPDVVLGSIARGSPGCPCAGPRSHRTPTALRLALTLQDVRALEAAIEDVQRGAVDERKLEALRHVAGSLRVASVFGLREDERGSSSCAVHCAHAIRRGRHRRGDVLAEWM